MVRRNGDFIRKNRGPRRSRIKHRWRPLAILIGAFGLFFMGLIWLHAQSDRQSAARLNAHLQSKPKVHQ
jgi:hypothetical protein